MIRIISVFFLFGMFKVSAGLSDDVRKNYNKMVSDERLCESSIADLKSIKGCSTKHLAYLGGLQTI